MIRGSYGSVSMKAHSPWEALHRHVLGLLGDPDISDYRSFEPLSRPGTGVPT